MARRGALSVFDQINISLEDIEVLVYETSVPCLKWYETEFSAMTLDNLMKRSDLYLYFYNKYGVKEEEPEYFYRPHLIQDSIFHERVYKWKGEELDKIQNKFLELDEIIRKNLSVPYHS